MTVVAVIPARGGSKGIPRKNLVPIGGVPLVARAVRAAKNCRAIDDVVVSTDSAEIGAVARSYGATVVDRPAELAGDRASTESALLHAVQTWSERNRSQCDILLLVQCTSPFHDPGDMEAVVEAVKSGGCNSCITILETFRYFWAEGPGGWHMPYQKRARRQERRAWFEEAGSLYCVRCELFVPEGNLFAPPVGAQVIPRWRAFEVDEPEDIKFAELLCGAYASEPGP